MKNEGPPLESLTRRLSECPPEFLEEPRAGDQGTVHVAAVVHDVLSAWGPVGTPGDPSWTAEFMPGADPVHPLQHVATGGGAPSLVDRLLSKISGTAEALPTSSDRDWLRCVLVACWLLSDDWFKKQKLNERQVRLFLTQNVHELSRSTQAPKLIHDPDRREELARLCLSVLGFRPARESIEQATDRLSTLNTAERMRLLRAVREAEKRAKEIREAMARKAAEEAAAKYNRE